MHGIFSALGGLIISERRYYATTLEELAVTFSLRKFQMFGAPVEVYADHEALAVLFKNGIVLARLC